MAQDPMLVDQIQIEPGSTGTRLIRRGVDGSIEFVDPVAGTITLANVSGLGAVTGVLVVGQSGSYTSIQAAIDAVPSSASPSNPFSILIQAGVYTEDVSLYRDGVSLVGMGGVTLRSLETTANGAGANNTLTIEAASGTIPQNVSIQNIRVENIHTNYACIRVLGAAGSLVGSGRVNLKGCDLVASQAAGNRPLWATSANNITWTGGSCTGSSTLGIAVVEECASLTLDGVRDLPALQLDYDSGGDLPSVAGSAYRVLNCDSIASSSLLAVPFAADLVGAGSLRISGCAGGPKLQVSGDQSVDVLGSQLGDLTLLGTTSAKLTGSEKGSVTSAVGCTLEESPQRGSVAFAASASETVTFSTPQPDNLYTISLEVGSQPAGDEVAWVSSKASTGFDISFGSVQTLTVEWVLLRVPGNATN